MTLPRCPTSDSRKVHITMCPRMIHPHRVLDIHPGDWTQLCQSRPPHPVSKHQHPSDYSVESPDGETGVEHIMVSPSIVESVDEVIPRPGKHKHRKDDVQYQE